MQSSTNKDKTKNKIMFYHLQKLKLLPFSTSKSYFIYFTTSLYNTPNIKYSIFLSLHLK